MAETVIRGNGVRFPLRDVRDINGDPITADPTTVVLRLTDHLGGSTDYTLAALQVVKESVGNYYYDWLTKGIADNQLGFWVGTFLTTGTPELANKRVIRLVSEKIP